MTYFRLFRKIIGTKVLIKIQILSMMPDMKRKKCRGMMLLALLTALLSATPSQTPELKSAPALTVSRNQVWGRAFDDVYRILLSNLREPEAPFTTRYVLPGPKFQKEIYLWDTAFIAQVWKWRDLGVSREIFFPLFQSARNGMLPHILDRSGKIKDSQPPVLAWSIWRLYQFAPDHSWLEQVYPYLRDYNDWLYRERRMGNGLFFWDNRFESGLDNSPRFTNRSATKVIPMQKFAAIDLCSYLVMDNLSLARMAEALGKKDDAEAFRKKADDLKILINQNLWDEKDGIYYDRDFASDRFIRVKSIASLIPLFAGIPDQAQARRLRDHIMNPAEFNTLIPLPSISRDDPTYQLDMWRGPVWINTAYLVILGLKDYGYKKEAGELTWKLVDGVFQVWSKTGTYYEFYHPEKLEIKGLHRKTGDLGTNFDRGDAPTADFVGWTGLVDNLVMEVLFGLGKNGECWTLDPNLPGPAEGLILSLSIPSENLQIDLAPDKNGLVKARVIQEQKLMTFELKPGKNAAW